MAIKVNFGGLLDDEDENVYQCDFIRGTVNINNPPPPEPEPPPDLFVDSKPALTPRSTNLEMEISAGRMNPEFARKHPTIAKGVTGVGNLLAKIFENPWVEHSGATGAEIMTMSDMPDKPTTGSTFGDVTADLAGTLAGFMVNPAGAAGRMPSIGANIWRGAEGVAEKVIPKLPGFAKLPDKIGRGAEYAGRIGGATAAFEGGRALANEREFDPLEMGLAAGANIGIDLATRGLLKGLSRRGTKTMVPEKDPGGFDFLQDVEYIPPDRLALPPGRQPTDFTVDPYGNTHIGELKAELPAAAERYMLQDEGQTPWSDIGKDVAGNATHKLSDTPFTDVYQELQPRVTEQTIPPAESTKALTNYIHDYFKGEISKNEIRRMSYDNMLDMAESIAKGRKSDLWDTMRTEGEKAGYDVDLRYRLETDPEYRAEWERLREVSGLADEPIRFKKGVPEKVEADVTDTPEFGSKSTSNTGTFDPTNPDIRFKQRDMTVQDYLDQIELQNAMTTRIGPFRIGKVGLAPEALEKPDFQAANDIAEKLGLRLVPFKGTRNRGMQQGRTIYLNKDMKDPLDYVFWHETAHTMETTHEEHYGKLMDIAFEHVKDVEGMQKHYERFRYDKEEVPHEFAADVFAEALSTPGFFARVAEKAPELLKPLLEAIDSLVERVKGMISKNDTVVPYLKNLETLRERVRQEVAMPYFKDATGETQFMERFGDQWQGPAAKTKGEVESDIRFKLGEQGPSPIDDLKAMVEYGASQLHKGGYEHFTKLLQKQFPEVFEGYSPEINDKLMAGVWFRAKELRNAGSTQVKLGDQVVNLGKGAEVASEVEPVKTLDEARLKEIDKEIKSLQSRIQGTRKSKTKYPTSEAKQAHINELQAEIDRLTKEREAASGTLLGGLGINPSELKDIGGYRLGLQDIWRNMRDVFGGKFEAVKERVLDPLEDAKAAWVDHQRALTDDLYTNVVEGLGIKKNSRESELVQLYGEGGYRHWETMPKGITKQKWLERLEAKHGAGNVTLTEDGAEITKPFTREDLVREVGEERAKDIIKAEQWFRQRYDQLLDQVNATRAQIYPGQQDKLVPKRKDYFRHFREMEGLEGVQNLFDTSAQIAPELAGKSMYTRPKSKFHGFMQQRKLGQYKPDAVGGFLEYLPSATYAIHIDPQGAAFRQLEKELVDVMGDKPGINKFLEYIKFYADDLQGKTNFFDRPFQALTSRKVFKGLVQLNNRIKSNVILANAGTMLAQLGNTPQGLSFAKQHSQPGLTRYIASAVERARDPEGFAANNPMAQSRFLKERYSADMYRRFDTKAMEKVKDVAVIGMEATDRVATEFMWNACYEKAINTKGIGDPIRYADSHTRRLVAGRGIGEVPLLQKAKVFQLFAPFQVEVGNFLNVVRDNAVDKDWAGLFVILPTTLFLFNKVAEHTKGSGVTIDPVQAIVDGIKIAQDDKDNKAYRIMGRMAGEVFSNMPAGQTVAAMAFDDVASKKFFGREDPTRYGASMLVAKGIFDPVYHILPPFGGLQAKKTLRGKEMLEKEGSYTKDESLRYPISTDPVNAAKGLVFGAGGFKETNDYYENEGRPLSKKQTEQYEKMVKSGMNREKAYNKIIYKRKVDSLQSQISEIRKDKGLTAEEKRSKLGPLQQKLRDLRTGA